MDWTEQLIGAMIWRGLRVVDLRASLPRHATRAYAHRDPGGLRGMVWHQALSYGYGQRAVEAIARYHVSPQSHLKAGGAPGFAYTLAVDADGTVYVANGVDVATWSHGQREVPDANTALIGVCALGWYSYRDKDGQEHPGDEPPPPQEAALIDVWRAAQGLWGWKADGTAGGLLGHDDLGKPACPGARLDALQDALRAGLPRLPLRSSLTLSGRARIAYQQACLMRLGYDLGASGVDGQDGAATKTAITHFQRDHGLVQDGRWGERTEAAMQTRMNSLYP